MQELFNILNLPENSSKENVRSAFLAWKKTQQQILSRGKSEEQKIAAENITKVTALYKQFMNNSGQSDNVPKISEEPKTITNPIQVTTGVNKVSPQPKVEQPRQDKKITEPAPPPVSVRTTDETATSKNITTPAQVTGEVNKISPQREIPTPPSVSVKTTDDNKSTVTVLVVLVVILCGSLLYLLNDKKNVAMDTASDFIKSPLKLTEESSIHSGRVIALEKPSQNNEPRDNSQTAETLKPTSKETNKPPEIPDKNTGKTASQRAAVQTLLDFHDNITKRNFGKAYDCLSWNFQSYMSYDGWVPGFATTVSSEVDDIKIVSENGNAIVLTYVLKAVDNINGRQETAYFNGIVTIINENGNWKIDEIKNKVR